MSRPLTPRSAARVAALSAIAASALAAAPAAHAANQTRFIGIDTDGTRTARFQPAAVSNDGTEIIGQLNEERAANTRLVIRDVAAGTTTPVLGPGDYIYGASGDLKRIVFSTTDRLSSGDTNDLDDVYLWDRPSNTFALVSRDQAGASLSETYGEHDTDVAISNRGTAIIFTHVEYRGDDAGNGLEYSQYRYEVPKMAIQQINAVGGAPAKSIGDDGTTIANVETVVSPSGTFPRQEGPRFTPLVTSPNGRFQAWVVSSGERIIGQDTTNGFHGTITPPSWLQVDPTAPADPKYTLEGIADDGSSVTVSGILERYRRAAIGRIDRSGNVRQVGSDIPLTSGSTPGPILSKNEQFAATGLLLVKLGDLPLPGTEPTAPPSVKMRDYFVLADSSCPLFNLYTAPASKPRLILDADPQESDFRAPVKATVKVFKDGATRASNDMTLSPGQGKDLYVGTAGGFRIEGKVTLAGGQVIQGVEQIPAHGPVVCN